jgi:hypothetical protein
MAKAVPAIKLILFIMIPPLNLRPSEITVYRSNEFRPKAPWR